jgi:hypothetical protein
MPEEVNNMLPAFSWPAEPAPEPAPAKAEGDSRINPDSSHRRFCRRSRASRLRGAWRMFRATLMLFSLMAAGFIIYTWLGMASAVRIVEQQAAAIRDGRIDDAYNLFSETYRAENSMGMFRAWVARHEEFSKAQDMRIWSRTMRNERAVLWGVVQDYQGQGFPVRYRMVRERGEWRIDEMTMRRSWAEEAIDELPPQGFI